MSVPRGVALQDLLARLADATGPHFPVRYQLPDKGLDALILVSSPKDLDGPKLRVFIFPSPTWRRGMRVVRAAPGLTPLTTPDAAVRPHVGCLPGLPHAALPAPLSRAHLRR